MASAGCRGSVSLSSNGEVEGPHGHARWRRGRTISQRPRRQASSASRPPPTIVRSHASAPHRHRNPHPLHDHRWCNRSLSLPRGRRDQTCHRSRGPEQVYFVLNKAEAPKWRLEGDGPLERLLEGLPPPPNKATQVTWHCLTARRRATPTSNETQRQTKPPRQNAPARAAAQRQRPRRRLSP